MEASSFIAFFLLAIAFHHSQALLQPHHLSNTTDQLALLSFKSHVTDDPNKVLETWNSTTSFCTWHGVLCNRNKNRVTGLNLGNRTLTGTISPHMTNLSFLRVLNLENNSFSGTIDFNFSRLFRLEILILASNHVGGILPPSLGRCSRIRVFDLSDNYLHGTIPSEFGNFPKLEDFSLGKNNLTGFIPPSFGNLSSLNNLILLRNKIQGPIPPELGRLRFLLRLNVGDNNISGTIPPSIFNLSSLMILGLAKNQISGNLRSDLFIALPNLTNLLLGGNLLEGNIPESFSNATNLQYLDLSANQFTGKVPLLWNLQNLIIFNIEINQLDSRSGNGNGLDFISSLTNSTLLEVLSVATNQFSGTIPSSIGNLSSQLLKLFMGENNFQGNIPESVGNLDSLTLLDLESNSLTGKIPSSIGNLQNLQNLFLGLNSLSGPIPWTFGNLSQLYELGLSRNDLTSFIPPILSNCQHLQLLDLSENGLNGSIPKEIFNFPNLGTLLINISWNYLSGSIPSEIGNMKMVQILDFSRNEITGPIPSTIGACSNLLYLVLSVNSFQGLIPNSLAKVKGLEYIDLSSNNLSGPIPSFDSLSYLQFLNLSVNSLQGEVPQDGIFLNDSAVFITGNPQLCGGIWKLGLPKCISPKTSSARLNKKLIVGLAVGSAAICVLGLLCLVVVLFGKRKKQKDSPVTGMISFDGPHRLYSYYDLKNATNNFSAENLIGEGSFGSVYKGVLRDGNLLAVKVFKMEQSGALKSFLSECEAFRNIRHRNLVKITSACSTPNFKALVLQFMPNGSLERWIHHRREDQREGFGIERRLEIAMDVASAVEYLHHECETPVVHCDLKPNNVLLDRDMVAHVGDFGLARMAHGEASSCSLTSTSGLKGSIGYIAPEYGLGAAVSAKGDVYSFGILLLEMLSGKKPTEEMFVGELNLQKWVEAAIPDQVLQILDDQLVENSKVWDSEHLCSLFQIGLLCAKEAPEERPDMKVVSPMIRRTRSLILKKNWTELGGRTRFG